MQRVTTIYVATARSDRFQFLEERFPKRVRFTDDYETADLIIVDLNDPGPRPWRWVKHPTQFLVAEPCPAPFLLTALDGPKQKGVFDAITSVYDDIPPIYESQDELERSLSWVQSMFPLDNMRKFPEVQRTRNEMVLQAMKMV